MALNLSAKLKEYAELVKFEHTVFALPFALSAMLLACPAHRWPHPLTVCWIILAMVGGRTYAMALNRLLDATIDAKNPRTQSRAIPAGRVQRWEGWAMAGVSALVLIGATLQLPPLCVQLLPVAFAILTVYSLMKRFSSLAHLVLGIALGSSAIGGWVAVTGTLTLLPVLFGMAVVFWVMGFDVMYACQDEAFDRAEGLHSIPAWLGLERSLWVSRGCHGLAVVFLASFGVLHPLTGVFYWLAVALMAIILVWEHRLVSPEDLSRLDLAFFTMNGRASVGVLLLVLLDKLTQQ